MMPSSHPDEAFLVDYSAGSLTGPFAVLIATHLTLCPSCRRAVAALEALGGDLLENGETAPVAADSLDRVLTRLDAPLDDEPARRPPHPITAGLPMPLREFLASSVRPLAWTWVIPGLRQIEIPCGNSLRARLMRITPGHAMPRHAHLGQEMTVVLEGGFEDYTGHFTAGDVAFADGDVIHQPRADAVEGCLCFAVTDAPLKLAGPIGKLLNFFIRY